MAIALPSASMKALEVTVAPEKASSSQDCVSSACSMSGSNTGVPMPSVSCC